MASISASKVAPTASATAKATAKAAEIAREQIAPRSISITVSPPPVNFAERRSVLQVLERHGRVEFFKAVPGHDSMFISLMKEKEAASRLITTSPLSYAVSAPQTAETVLSNLNARETLAKSKPVTQIKTKDTLSSTLLSSNPNVKTDRKSPQKEFKIEVWPHPTYRHHISSRSMLHRSWPDFVGEDESFIAKTLKQSLPNTMAAKGLANWNPDVGKHPTAAASKLKMHERIQMLSWIPGKLQGSNRQREPKDAEPETAVPSTHNTS